MVGVGVVSGSWAHSIFYPSDVHNQTTALGWQLQKGTGRKTSKRALKAAETENQKGTASLERCDGDRSLGSQLS